MSVNDRELGWLAGFFDGEGCISYSFTRYKGKEKLRPYIVITNTDKNLMLKAQSVLDELGIDSMLKCRDSGRPHSKPIYRLNINNSHGINRFFELVPINSEAKLARFEELRRILPNRSHQSKARRERLARHHPELL